MVTRRRYRRQRGWIIWLSHSRLVDFLAFWLFVAILTLTFSPITPFSRYTPEAGTIALRDVKADRDILIEDQETTEQRRLDAVESVLPIYDWDSGMMDPIARQLQEALAWLAETRRNGKVTAIDKLREGFAQRLEEEISPETFQKILEADAVVRKVAITQKTKSHQEDKGGAVSVDEPPSPALSKKSEPSKETERSAKKSTDAEEEKSVPAVPIIEKSVPTLETASPVVEQRVELVSPKTVIKPYAEFVEVVRAWLLPFNKKRVVSGPEVLKDLARSSYMIHSVVDSGEKKGSGAVGLMDLEGLKHLLRRDAQESLKELNETLRAWVLREVYAHVRPNFVLNLAETKLQQEKAREAVETVYFRVLKDEMIVREGEIVSEAARLKIDAMNQENLSNIVLSRVMGLIALLVLLLLVARRFLYRTSAAFPSDRRTIYLLGTIVLSVSLLSVFILRLGQGIAELFQWPVEMAIYLPPAVLGAALASLIIGSRHSLPGGAMVVGMIISFLMTLKVDGGLPLFMYFMVGSMVGGFTLRSSRHRFGILLAGLWIGLFQMIAVPMVEALTGNLPSWDLLTGCAMALTSGILSGLLGLAIIPLLELVFNITTDSRLVELASGDHPLLKELSMRAPGTYHHSVMMGNLAEAAAETIGANPLMARVMALYHDIGKMNKPHYFIENQHGENRHDHLLPYMSAKVIMSHIKDGVELASQYKLGGPILDAIKEHQGTGLLRFFYNKAVHDASKRGGHVSEEDFRYPGPRPQSRESGILMIADSVEAAARTLKNPSPAHIQSLVRRIINSKIGDGQLDECQLTLRELSLIEEAFCRVLTLGFYHHRIEYPDQIKKRSV
ncbi:MAG: HDIG domain-containing protein [Magnetococcales bacterium]|nr:HDIG domain-containing protein [Magnetococcales bacterium]